MQPPVKNLALTKPDKNLCVHNTYMQHVFHSGHICCIKLKLQACIEFYTVLVSVMCVSQEYATCVDYVSHMWDTRIACMDCSSYG